MALIDHDQNDGFSFIWTILNFSYCVEKTGKWFNSPSFTLNTNNPEQFQLFIYPRGRSNDNCVTVVFGKEDTKKNVGVSCEISIRTVSGSYKLLNSNIQEVNVFLMWRQAILKKGTEEAYLDNDSLTIRCRILKAGDRILETEQCYARTEIQVERAIYTWNLKNLGDQKLKDLGIKKHINMSEISSFTTSASMSKGIFEEDRFEMIIKRESARKCCFSTCVISLLEQEKVLRSQQNEHWFEQSNGEQSWAISFVPNYSFLTNTEQHSTINLRCELNVSFGVKDSRIEKIVYDSTVNRPLLLSKPSMDSNNLSSWAENLRCFYLGGKFSDLTIRTPRKMFPVHKAILCAQSAVFEAMFERDMEENRTGIVDIIDLEDETVSRMLLFVYTSSVENLDWEMASKLYFAADKYEMKALREKCSVFLKDNLDISNACKLLVLADMHHDQDLKSVAQDFVIEHSTDIINSEEWKKFMKEQLQLAAETMHEMCMRNLKV